MRIGRLVTAGVCAGILEGLWGFLTCGWLCNWVYRLEPVSVWKPVGQMNFALMNVMTVLFSIILALIYVLVSKVLPGKGVVKGFWFGLFVWLVGALPGMFAMGIFTVIAQGVIIYWLINTLIISILKGIVISAIYRE